METTTLEKIEAVTDPRWDTYQCPSCSGALVQTEATVRCCECHHQFVIDQGIPLLFWPNEWDKSKGDVTDLVKSFYEKTPFPNYEDLETSGDLIQKAERGIYARLLNEHIPFNIRVLEVGCGTGQLSNFLGIAKREVIGVDMCLNSLSLAQRFKERNHLDNVSFAQMNLFRPIFKEETFPLVLCNGVLHHTSDPFGGFRSIAKLVQKGGYIIIGLYHTYGRLITDARRLVFKLSRNQFKFLDPRLRATDRGEAKRNAWFADQYQHPHESKHTQGEVLSWFEQEGFEFISGIPNLTFFEDIDLNKSLFTPQSAGSSIDRFLRQTAMMFSGSQEGGFFIMIGRRKK